MPEPADQNPSLSDTAFDGSPPAPERPRSAAETGADVEYIPPSKFKPHPAAPSNNVADVALDEILDRVEASSDTSSLTRYDPEAGHTNVSVKIRAATEAIRNSVNTPFGKLMSASVIGLAGLSLAIAAFTLQTMPWIIAAAVVAPVGGLLVYWRYQAWLGHKRYMYRLLETLGEDVTDFDPRKVYRKIGSTKKPR
jgi:hypothetical protein